MTTLTCEQECEIHGAWMDLWEAMNDCSHANYPHYWTRIEACQDELLKFADQFTDEVVDRINPYVDDTIAEIREYRNTP